MGTWGNGWNNTEPVLQTVTDPLANAAVSTAIVDRYDGVIITLTGAGNAQTLQAPTLSAPKYFTVINNDTSGANAIAANGITLAAGKAQSFVWDGTAWGPTDLGITAVPVPIAQGGTGAITKGGAFDALSPMSVLGDVTYGGASGTGTRLAGNTTATKKFLRQTGDGANSAAPAWDTIVDGDLPATIKGLTLAPQATGFTIAGGTTSKTLTVELDSAVNQDLTTDAVVTHAAVNTAKPANIADSATPAIGAAAGNAVDLDGTTTIVSFDNVAAGITRLVTFTGARIITHNAVSLILPGARNITTTAGDRATFISLGAGNWRCHEYLKTSGLAIGNTDEQIIAATGNMSLVQAYGGLVNNLGQAADTVVTLPAAAKGMNFAVILGTTVAKYFRLDPAAGDAIYLDGVVDTDGHYVGIASAVAGAAIQFVAFQTGANAYDWLALTVSGSWVAE